MSLRFIEQFRHFAAEARRQNYPVMTVVFRPETLDALADLLEHTEGIAGWIEDGDAEAYGWEDDLQKFRASLRHLDSIPMVPEKE